MAPLASYAGSRGTGTPPGISSEELISASDDPTHY